MVRATPPTAICSGFLVVKGDNATTHSFTLVNVAVYPITDLAVNLEFGSSGAAAARVDGRDAPVAPPLGGRCQPVLILSVPPGEHALTLEAGAIRKALV